MRAEIAQPVKRLAKGWTVRGSNPVWDDIFRTRPDRPLGLPTLLHNGYRISFPGVKRAGRGVNHPPHLVKVKVFRYKLDVAVGVPGG